MFKRQNVMFTIWMTTPIQYFYVNTTKINIEMLNYATVDVVIWGIILN